MIKKLIEIRKELLIGVEVVDLLYIKMQINKLDTLIFEASKNNAVLPDVIKRALAYLLIIPAILLYFILLLIINPLQYLLFGKAFVAQKFHKYIANIIDRHGL